MFYLVKFLHFFLSHYVDFPASVPFSNLNTSALNTVHQSASPPSIIPSLPLLLPWPLRDQWRSREQFVLPRLSVYIKIKYSCARSASSNSRWCRWANKKNTPSFHGNLHHPFPSPLAFCVHVGSRRRDAGITSRSPEERRTWRKKKKRKIQSFCILMPPPTTTTDTHTKKLLAKTTCCTKAS